jgi:hypothetical protein
MRFVLAVAALMMVMCSSPTWADETFADCAKTSDAKARLGCFDRVSREAGLESTAPSTDRASTADNVSGSNTTTTEPSPATTKDIVMPTSSSEYHVADPADIAIAPRKFVGKQIEVRHVHCYYADKDDYRCIAPGSFIVAIFTPDIIPLGERERVENDCGAMKMMMTAKCERTIHLVYDEFRQDEVETRNRVTVRPKFAVVVPQSSAPGGRKRP